ncbi:unnamed protein product [Tuber melanosporum]|uniref:(Perigord truffle) hypothetical protein n=1 Tax=Tuber melanosporum (strain Mel28) TaxID=656061 RepID=D5GK42_TUBMM|nr:uncharacterized protein GSTUM_00009356001 [Tuber melanosporum]CAZ84885.1 unnamed protein product [Tuber melanosporum]
MTGPTPDQKNLHYFVSGVSSISLIAPTEELFYTTVAFYTDLGFDEAFVYDRTHPTVKREDDHCRASEKETWLYSQGAAGDGTDVNLKIRYVVEAGLRRQSLIPPPIPPNSEEWRGKSMSVILYTPALDRVIDLLSEKKIAFQSQPSEKEPSELDLLLKQIRLLGSGPGMFQASWGNQGFGTRRDPAPQAG